MKKYLCTVCGHVYDEDAGDEKANIPQKTAFESLPEKWTCPVCGAFQLQFREITDQNKTEETIPKKAPNLSALKNSVICSNLAKACEKQHKTDSAAVYHSLAREFKEAVPKPDTVSFSALQKECVHDIASLVPIAKKVAEKYGLTFVELQKVFDNACEIAEETYWLADGVHPTNAGHR